ncbi:4516_t:CDS:2 [Funneliformis mosseae]|uniref:4516_t:CDS:1 n=1 Tax=Funneliformis mosseae TaxID=27381 RepID=A0A9N8VF39_FUNMO|nr:4516_t:CDS:2 [Funneliformis mosseae]
MTFKGFNELSQNFLEMHKDADDYNVIIKVGKSPNIKEFRAHSNILKARSPYFKRAFSQNWIKIQNNMIHFDKPNISPTVFEMILRTTDLESWNETDFLALKNTLDQFISHIRFFEMSSIDFHNNVWPFREVLPKKLFESIISFHMSKTQPRQHKFPRHRKIAIDSTIIKSKHATILANWIQRKDAIAKIPKGEDYFRLIYRGSRDGYDFDIIRNKCILQGAYILLIKVKENGSIIGGYNPLGWNFNQNQNWVFTCDSFIFSLGDGKYFQDFKLCRVTDSSKAICNNALKFGNSDLVVNVNRGTCNQQSYQGSILDINAFTIEEMEIFAYMSPPSSYCSIDYMFVIPLVNALS